MRFGVDFVERLGTGGDFASYYHAAAMARTGGNPYDNPALSAFAGRPARGPRSLAPFLYPPPFLLLVAWAPAVPMEVAAQIWLVLNELAVLAVGLLLWWWWRSRAGPFLIPLTALALAGYPVVSNASLGQVNLVVLALLLAGLLLEERGRAIAGGALVGLACMAKMSPALFVAWWALHGRWRAVAAACACAVLLSLVSLPLVGFEAQLAFYRDVLPGFSSGDYNGLQVPIGMLGNHSIPNLYHEWLPGGRTLSAAAQAISQLTAIVLLAGLAWWFRRQGDALATAGQVSAVAIATLLLPVYTYEHHLVWAIPALVITAAAVLSGRLARGWALPVGFAWLALTGNPGRIFALHASFAGEGHDVLALLVRETKFLGLVAAGAAAVRLGGSRGGAQPDTADSAGPKPSASLPAAMGKKVALSIASVVILFGTAEATLRLAGFPPPSPTATPGSP